ncbi:MAG: 2-oxoacid:acceptor oxidoreductase family protein [Phycisphaerales bacterium]|nr:2-oxoacid:acceptor oxidoreductase family protein [Phycisphaerales bacterium]
MFQVRIHGRGGQGVVTAAEMLSVAAFLEGRSAQAFPSFGSERMGAPVMAFCRIDTREIRLREPIADPDALIVQDPTLLYQASVFEGLSPEGFLLVNSGRDPESLGIGEVLARLPAGHMVAVPATELALEHVGRPLPNAVLLGAFCALTGAVGLESLAKAIRDRFPGDVGERNVGAARAAFELVASKGSGMEGAARHVQTA